MKLYLSLRKIYTLVKPLKRSQMNRKFCLGEKKKVVEGNLFDVKFSVSLGIFLKFSVFSFFRGGDKHIDSSGSDSDLDMPGIMSVSNNQSTSKGSHNMTANLQHNLLLQQGLTNSQLGESSFVVQWKRNRIWFWLILGQMPQGYSPSTSHSLHHNVPPLHHYDMDAYQNLWF